MYRREDLHLADATSRTMREYHVRTSEGLGVKFLEPTRHSRRIWPTCGPPWLIVADRFYHAAVCK